ncbi:hypothetical protein RhiirA5_152762 [Rhizophagus irregularis]|uniref:Uncharacterized protein n=1 Tax=Rhizophagus irregularis TaxID=588596 RepID=A0A2N0PSG1_9GLOM|nr:hypothetical protein RhiirA5_152762 [Rhizophagus irregularis]
MIQSDSLTEQNREIQSLSSPERQTTTSSQKRNVFQQLSPSLENHVEVELPLQKRQTVNSLSSQRMLVATESAHYAALNKFKIWNQPAEIPASTAYEHAVRCEVILTFKEDRKTRFLFPKDAIIERNPEGDDNFYEVIASYVSPSDENDVKRSRDNPEEWEISIKSVTEEIWNALYRTVNDEDTVERLMDEKLKRKCKERYLQMRVPRDFNREKIKKYQKTWTTTIHVNESKTVDEVIDIEKKTDDSEIDVDIDITVGRKRGKRKAPGQKRTASTVAKKVRKTKNTSKNDIKKQSLLQTRQKNRDPFLIQLVL